MVNTYYLLVRTIRKYIEKIGARFQDLYNIIKNHNLFDVSLYINNALHMMLGRPASAKQRNA